MELDRGGDENESHLSRERARQRENVIVGNMGPRLLALLPASILSYQETYAVAAEYGYAVTGVTV